MRFGKRFTFRIEPAQLQQLARYAASHGISLSDAARHLIVENAGGAVPRVDKERT
jgi:hypothetical protein